MANYCMHGGTPFKAGGGDWCICMQGFGGRWCQEDVRDLYNFAIKTEESVEGIKSEIIYVIIICGLFCLLPQLAVATYLCLRHLKRFQKRRRQRKLVPSNQ